MYYSRRLPALERFYRETKSGPSQSQNQAKNIPVGLLSSTNQNLKQIGPGVPELWSDEQTNKQTNRDYNFIYRYKPENKKTVPQQTAFKKVIWKFLDKGNTKGCKEDCGRKPLLDTKISEVKKHFKANPWSSLLKMIVEKYAFQIPCFFASKNVFILIDIFIFKGNYNHKIR